jgi:beta-lactamase regulating signal transducer with metallopeptidase domain/5-hydroxyisourate hydrolase-like protein (transthyretin family)
MRIDGPAAILIWGIVEAAAKATALLAAAAAIGWVLRRRSSAVRHWVWLLALLGTVVLPLLSVLLPGWRVLPAWAGPGAGAASNHTQHASAAVAAEVIGESQVPARHQIPAPDVTRANSTAPKAKPPSPGAAEMPARTMSSPARAAMPLATPPAAANGETMAFWICAIWGFGVFVVLLHWVVGLISLRRLAGSARVVSAGPLADLLSRTARDLRVGRRVVLLQSHCRQSPMTWGLLMPKVLLPDGAEDWPRLRQQLALSHELAHVKRWDALTQLIGRLACAIYWFNPLIWMAARALAREQEYAADDLVLCAPAPASEYAQLLLDIAGTVAGLRFMPGVSAGGAIAMARAGRLEKRLRAILDGARHRTSLSGLRLVAGLLLMVGVVVPIAALHAQSPQAVPKAPSYAGRVLTPDGTPATGAEVILLDVTRTGERQQVAVMRAGDDGTFAFYDVKPAGDIQRLSFVARASGLAPTASAVFPGADPENEFALSPASMVRVTFVDPDGKPVPNLQVTPTMVVARDPGGLSTIFFPPELAKRFARQTDAAGACTFDDMPRRYSLHLHLDDPRFAQLSFQDYPELADNAVTPPVTVKLRRGGSIAGTVRYGPTGLPAAGVHVVAQSLSRSRGSGWGQAISNDRGEYRMQQIPVGEYNVAVNFNDDRERPWAAAALEAVHLGEGEHLAGQDLTLVTGGLIKGHVLRADTGQAVIGVNVGLHGPDRPKSSAMIAGVITDADGAYTFRVAPGAQYVYLSGFPPDGYARPAAEELIVAAGQAVTVDLKVPRRPGKPVAGRVVGPDGKPVAGAHIVAETKGDRFDGVIAQTTDPTGTFHFAAVTPGTRIRAVRGSMSTFRAVFVNGGEQDIVLNLTKRLPRTISGLITDTVDGKPIKGARVQVITWQGSSGMTTGKPELTDAEGRYSIRGLSPDGTYSLNAEADDYGQSGAAVTLDPDRETTQAQPLQLDRLTARIGGRVVDASGKPVAGVSVEINGSRNGNRTTVTDAEGRFTFKVLEGSVPLIFLRDIEGKPSSSQGVRAGDEKIELTQPSR